MGRADDDELSATHFKGDKESKREAFSAIGRAFWLTQQMVQSTVCGTGLFRPIVLLRTVRRKLLPRRPAVYAIRPRIGVYKKQPLPGARSPLNRCRPIPCM